MVEKSRILVLLYSDPQYCLNLCFNKNNPATLEFCDRKNINLLIENILITTDNIKTQCDIKIIKININLFNNFDITLCFYIMFI